MTVFERHPVPGVVLRYDTDGSTVTRVVDGSEVERRPWTPAESDLVASWLAQRQTHA